MFFIGIFGIENKSNIILIKQSNICPLCGGHGGYAVIKSYRYFHAFFIPLWHFHVRYSIQTHCCDKICELDQDIGQGIERGEAVGIENNDIHCIEDKAAAPLCPNCGSKMNELFVYCPYCGGKINSSR